MYATADAFWVLRLALAGVGFTFPGAQAGYRCAVAGYLGFLYFDAAAYGLFAHDR